MSADLATKIQLSLDELNEVRTQMSPLIARTNEPELPAVETAAACAMLHSFYTEIEKILKIIAIDRDKKVPSSESWHRDLLTQMAAATGTRPPVLTNDLVTRLAELLAFRQRAPSSLSGDHSNSANSSTPRFASRIIARRRGSLTVRPG